MFRKTNINEIHEKRNNKYICGKGTKAKYGFDRFSIMTKIKMYKDKIEQNKLLSK